MATDEIWVWDGGRICLDFVNTLRFRWKSTAVETLRSPADLTGWLREAGVLVPGAPAHSGETPASAVAEAHRLREAIDRAALTVAAAQLPTDDDIALLNHFAAQAPRPAPQLTVADGRLAPATLPGTAATADAALALIAQDTVHLLLSADAKRVRVCGSDRCSLRFLDSSPAHNRRWCSMARCGNRTKVRRHQARARAGDAHRAPGGNDAAGPT